MAKAPGAVQPQGPWGSFPASGKNQAFNPYGWALVNADGTFANSSGNLTMAKGGAGIYNLVANDTINPAPMLGMAIPIGPIPFVASIFPNAGPGNNAITVQIFNSATQASTDEPFLFMMWVGNGF